MTSSRCSASTSEASELATYRVVSWRDIPASVEAQDETGTVTRPLSERFQALIDAVAMQLGLAESDAYLDAWRRGDSAERPGSAADVAGGVAAEIEADFAAYAGRALR